MMKNILVFLMAILFTFSGAIASEKKEAPKADKPAVVKECKDKDGKVIKCPEPKKEEKKDEKKK